MGQRQDSLKQLTELVHKGEKKGLFSNKMPARIQQVVREENLLFMRNRNVYDADYFTFVRELCSKNTVRTCHCLVVCNLCEFLMHALSLCCMDFVVEGVRPRGQGRPKRAWKEVIVGGMKSLKLSKEAALVVVNGDD